MHAPSALKAAFPRHLVLAAATCGAFSAATLLQEPAPHQDPVAAEALAREAQELRADLEILRLRRDRDAAAAELRVLEASAAAERAAADLQRFDQLDADLRTLELEHEIADHRRVQERMQALAAELGARHDAGTSGGPESLRALAEAELEAERRGEALERAERRLAWWREHGRTHEHNARLRAVRAAEHRRNEAHFARALQAQEHARAIAEVERALSAIEERRARATPEGAGEGGR